MTIKNITIILLMTILMAVGATAQCIIPHSVEGMFSRGDEKMYLVGGQESKIIFDGFSGNDIKLEIDGKDEVLEICEPTDINGITYTVANAIDGETDVIKLYLYKESNQKQYCDTQADLSGSAKVGEKKVYLINGVEYEVEVLDINGDKVLFRISGEDLEEQGVCESVTLSKDYSVFTITPKEIKNSEVIFDMKARSLRSEACESEMDLEDQIFVEQKKVYTLEGKEIEIIPQYASDYEIVFSANGDYSEFLKECQAYRYENVWGDESLWIVPISITPKKVSFGLYVGDELQEKEESNEIEANNKEDVDQTSVEESNEIETNNKEDVDQTSVEENKETEPSKEEVKTIVIEKQVSDCSSGCMQEDRCIPVGTRQDNHYCSLDGKIVTQVFDEAKCDNNYECLSNQCYNSVCQSIDKDIKESKGILKKIFDWFSNFF